MRDFCNLGLLLIECHRNEPRTRLANSQTLVKDEPRHKVKSDKWKRKACVWNDWGQYFSPVLCKSNTNLIMYHTCGINERISIDILVNLTILWSFIVVFSCLWFLNCLVWCFLNTIWWLIPTINKTLTTRTKIKIVAKQQQIYM